MSVNQAWNNIVSIWFVIFDITTIIVSKSWRRNCFCSTQQTPCHNTYASTMVMLTKHDFNILDNISKYYSIHAITCRKCKSLMANIHAETFIIAKRDSFYFTIFTMNIKINCISRHINLAKETGKLTKFFCSDQVWGPLHCGNTQIIFSQNN